MNSSMLAGERRWASARRGGMTVLGKVAVPKPINLPSQRLENHGLHPNVEIVPKGTASWGSRSSSLSSNPWASSSLSPNADGGTVSPSHLSGRPSSGGSGTRPSTSGSDRTHDLVPNAWGSNSRPSSASGTLSSNQSSSASLRPRSAENRPNSSQLSRFAEPVSKSTTTWGSSATAERLGVKSSKDDGFSLSSGDFPTLGSEKDNLVKNIDSQDHNRPNSASGRINQAKEDAGPHDDVEHGPVNTWRADGSQGAEDDIHPSMEKWQVDHHQYFNANNHPQRFDAWRGPPMNGPAGVWYGGRPPGPPFGAHVPPGGFPMEPFPYYRPQIPPPPLAGSQPVPPPGPRGAHPKNGDLYRPQMPDAYPRPGMPFRPGFYPGPPGPMPFEGYYGPPMSYCNERDIPYMGMQAGPPVYNGYPPPNADISNPHGRAAGRGPAGKTMQEQGEADQWEDAYGPKRVHIMSHSDCEQRDGGVNREQNMQPTVSQPGKSRHPVSFRKNEWGAEEDTEEAVFSKRSPPAETFPHSFENRAHSADSMKVKSLEGMGNVKGVNDNWMNNKTARGPSLPPVVSPLPVASERDLTLPASDKKSALMNKIDGLNAKFRASDGWNEFPSAYKGEERNGSKIVDMKNTNNTEEVSNNTAGSLERTLASRESVATPHEVIGPVGDHLTQPIAVVSRRPYYGGQSRVDQRGKGKFNGQDVDGWRRKPMNTESLGGVAASNNESAPNTHPDAPNIVGEASESLIVDPEGKIEGDSVETHDLTDIQAQRAKMRELAKQRALQRQKEEEERIKEQKAKARAKLEELNRRTLAGEAANLKTEKTQVTGDIPTLQEESHNQKTEKTQVTGDTPTVQEESHPVVGPMIAELNVEESGFNLVPGPAVAAVDRGSNANQAVESVEVLKNVHLEMKPTGTLESNESPILVNEESHDNSTKKGASQANDGGYSRHKKPGYKQRQNNSLQKSMNDNSTHESHSSDAPNVPNILMAEPHAQQRRKTNRSTKTKPKPDEASAAPALPPITSDSSHGNESFDNGGPNNSLPNLENAVQTLTETETETGMQAQEGFSPLSYEESQCRVSNQWKQHHSRRLPRSQPAHRSADKLHGSDTVVWAPVHPQNKAKGSDEASQNSVQESANSAKGGNNVGQTSLKGKRAEMERYVPKPVAKELAQPVNIPLLSSSICSSTSNEGSGWEQSGSVSSANPHSGPGVEIERYGIDSHNKHKKDHGTWKQRGSTDSSHVKGGNIEPIPTSEPKTDIQQSKELAQSVRSEIAANADAKVKDQGATGRGKRHQQRGPRSTGKYPDSENNFSCEIDGISSIQSAAPDVNQTDRNIASKENRSIVERTSSHWQPKSSLQSAINQHGSRATGSESVATEVYRNPKKDHPPHKQSGSAGQSEPGQSVNVKNNVAQESVVGHHRPEFDREKKPAPAKVRPYSPRQDPVGSGESTTNTGDQLERNAPSGSRRNMRQNNRPIRSNDSRGDWSSGHENRPAFRERQRQNVQYEYQPVGPVKGNKSEEPADAGAGNSDQRHRERGQSQSKRGGNFYRRQSGAVHVGSGRD